jgi:hypothetical protein
VTLALVVLLASWAPAVCKGSRVTKARQARWVSKVFLAFPARLAPWVSKVLSVPRVSLVPSVSAASRVSKVQEACVVLPVLPVQPVLSAFVARLDLPVFRVSKVLLASRVTQAHRV